MEGRLPSSSIVLDSFPFLLSETNLELIHLHSSPYHDPNEISDPNF